MLQNRVDPFGNIIKTEARGAWMGNRGAIHDRHKNLVRPFRLKAWITCLLQFKGWHREVMTPGWYTELFFLDEATAFAAGHRPCAECRRADFNKFKEYWLKGNPEYGFTMKTLIGEIDNILHRERMAEDGTKLTHEADLLTLPEGSFIVFEGRACLLQGNQLHGWTPFGYESGVQLPEIGKVMVLTPKSTINTFKAGYVPEMRLHG